MTFFPLKLHKELVILILTTKKSQVFQSWQHNSWWGCWEKSGSGKTRINLFHQVARSEVQVMETLDYFVLILVVLAYLGWFLARDTGTRSEDT